MVKHVKPSMGCGYGVTLVLAAAGVGLAGWAPNSVGRTVGAVLVVLAVIYVQFARRAVRASELDEKRRAELPDQPWLWRKEWSGPAIESEDGKRLWLHWLFAVMWNGISLPAVFGVLRQGLHDKAAYLVFLFPLAGVGLLASAIYKTSQRTKYGRIRFLPASLPGVIGGCLGGVIEVPARVDLEADAHIALRCVRRVRQGTGKKRSMIETVLWEHEEFIPAAKWVSEATHTTIPVLFDIPPGSAASEPGGDDNEVVWRLSAEAKTPGVDFTVSFVVPVYVTAESSTAGGETRAKLGAYRVMSPGLEATDWANAGVEQQPDSFRFGAAHLRRPRWVLTAISVGLFALVGLLIAHHAPGVFWAVAGFFAAIMGLMTASLWWSNYEVSLVGADVVVRTSRPWGQREWRVPRADVVAVRPAESMRIGNQAYFRLVMEGKPGADERVAAPGEPFRARKLRYQLTKQPAAVGGESEALRAQLRAVARFEITFAGNVPGPTLAERVSAEMLAWINPGAGKA